VKVLIIFREYHLNSSIGHAAKIAIRFQCFETSEDIVCIRHWINIKAGFCSDSTIQRLQYSNPPSYVSNAFRKPLRNLNFT
jgi:hypothetical protein